MTLADERPVQPHGTDAQPSALDGRAGGKAGKAGKDGAAPRKHHGHTDKTILPACRAFINFPNDRDTLPLEIPGIAGPK